MPARVDYSKTKTSMLGNLLRFVRGLRHERQQAVNLKQIHSYFHGTPQPFVDAVINDALTDGLLDIRRTTLGRARHNCAYTYVLTEAGRQKIFCTKA